MTSEHQAFLNAIIANPEDDLPRLVFADYLEESGEPALVARAHYIRWCIRDFRGELSEEEQRISRQKQRELQSLFTDEVEAVMQNLSASYVKWYGKRGFAGTLETDWLTFLQLAAPDRIARHVPVEKVFVVRYLQRAAIAPIHLDESVSSFLEANEATGFWPVEELHCPTLKELYFEFMPAEFQEPVLSVVLRLLYAPRLRVFSFQIDGMTDAVLVRFLAQWSSSRLSQTVKVLNFCGDPISDAIANTLIAANGLDQLERIRLIGNRLTPASRAMLKRRFGDRLEFEEDQWK